MKLREEHKELLRELSQSASWEALEALFDIILNNHAQQVINCDLGRGPRELLIQKARYDGAKSFATALRSIKQDLKPRRKG